MLKVYLLYEHELDAVAKGSSGSTLLNFAFALLPTAITLLVALLTTTVTQVVLTVFVCAFFIFLLAGLICLVLGWQTGQSARSLVKQIKARMPAPEQVAGAEPPEGFPNG